MLLLEGYYNWNWRGIELKELWQIRKEQKYWTLDFLV